MPLTCDCYFDEYDDSAPWYWRHPWKDYETMPKRIRRDRCGSCCEFLNTGDIIAVFPRGRSPKNDIETRIYGDDEMDSVPLAPIRLCERCADLFYSFDDLGFCVSPMENMLELIEEYKEMDSE